LPRSGAPRHGARQDVDQRLDGDGAYRRQVPRVQRENACTAHALCHSLRDKPGRIHTAWRLERGKDFPGIQREAGAQGCDLPRATVKIIQP